jgi:hypothetical protein
VGCCFRCPRLHRENFPAKGLDVSLGDELRATVVHDVQLLAALVTPRLGVRLVVETLKVLLWCLVPQFRCRRGSVGVGDLLLARPPRWGGVILGGLLASLADALRELQDLTPFEDAVAGPRMDKTRPRVAKLLVRTLAALVLAPGRCRRSTRSSSLWLVCTAVLLVLLLASTRGSSTGAPRLGGTSLRGRVPRTALCCPGTLVRQGKQGGDSLHLMGRQLLQHLLITDPLSESHDNRCIGNTWNSSTYLDEAGHEVPEGFPGLLPHSVEVGLHAVLLVLAGEVCRKQHAEFSPGLDGSRGEVHEPCPG